MKFLRSLPVLTWLLIGLSSLVLLVTMPSGQRFCGPEGCGIAFWGAHEHDGVWHLAVIAALLSHFPFQLPNMSGAPLLGYNYLLDLILALMTQISHLSPTTWYFLILPLVSYLGMVAATLHFARTYRNNKTFPAWLLFFTFFGSSLGFVLTWLHGRGLQGASSLLLMQPLQYPLNPQLFLSLILLYPYLLFVSRTAYTRLTPLWTALYLFLFFGLKFYTGVLALVIWVASLFLVQRRMHRFSVISEILGVGVGVWSAYLLFYKSVQSSGFPLHFKPFATVNPIVEDPQLFYNGFLANRLYLSHDWTWYLLEFGVVLIFLTLNFGTRILAWIGLALPEKSNPVTTKLRHLISVGGIVGTLLTIFFVQRGVWWNTVQFMYVSFFLFGILAAEGADRLMAQRTWWHTLLIALTIFFTLPTNLDILTTFGRFPGTSFIPDDEMAALTFLRSQPRGTVFTPLFTRDPAVQSSILRTQYDTAYIPAYSGKPTYLSDLVQLDLTGVDFSERRRMSARYDCTILTEVAYLYETIDHRYAQAFTSCPTPFKPLFSNMTVTIYQVQNNNR